MNPLSVIDLATFEALKDAMGVDFITDLVQAYLDETPLLLTKLQDALAKQDCAAFRQAAHSIKSTSNSFGALDLGALAKELEFMGREERLDGASGKVKSLVSGFETVKQALVELSHG